MKASERDWFIARMNTLQKETVERLNGGVRPDLTDHIVEALHSKNPPKPHPNLIENARKGRGRCCSDKMALREIFDAPESYRKACAAYEKANETNGAAITAIAHENARLTEAAVFGTLTPQKALAAFRQFIENKAPINDTELPKVSP